MKTNARVLYYSDEYRPSCTLISAGEDKRGRGLPWTSGQGTIEYLVILAVVVVISLVVVALVTGMFQSPSMQISSSNETIGNLTSGGISIIDSVSDFNGESLIRLQNNSGESLTLEKITIGDSETSFDEQLVFGDAKSFSLSDLDLSCPCVEGQESVSCSFTFYFTTQNGLEKKQSITIKTDCQETIEATNPAQVVGLGIGTFVSPWIINSCNELQDMNTHLDGNYALGADINCFETINWNNGSGFIPIGLGTYFTGTLNGKNHTISNLYIHNQDSNFLGLFSKISGATISDIGLVDINVSGENKIHVGGIAGDQLGGLISNSYVTGNISGFLAVGGLVGADNAGHGTISNSYFKGNVIGMNRMIGGLVGTQWHGGVITNSYAIGNIFGSYVVGGLVGDQYLGNIYNSYFLGTVTGDSNEIGGIIGEQFAGALYNSYFIGTAQGANDVGGLVGTLASFKNGTKSNIYNSYSAGEIIGTQYTGGIVGDYFEDNYNYLGGHVYNSFSTCEVLGTISSGGLIGRDGIYSADIDTNVYWDIILSGQSNCRSDGNTGCTSTNNSISDYYDSLGVAKLNNDSNWIARDGNYPILSWQ